MRLYLAGAGAIARTHVQAAAKLGTEIELRVADPASAVLEDFLSLYPQASGFASVEEMLGSESPCEDDIVVIATPPFAHLEPTLLALRSGRHVLCEKPLAMTGEEAEQMLAVATATGRLLGSCSTRFRMLPHTEAVKRVLADGLLGDVYHLDFVTRWSRSRAGIEYQPSSRWFLDSARSGGGVLADWGPYDISTLFDLLEPTAMEVVDAWMAKPATGADPTDTVFDVETDVGATLRFTLPDDSVLSVNYGRATGTHAEESATGQFAGTRGAVAWAPFDSHAPVLLRTDRAGAIVEEEVQLPPRPDLAIYDRPLVFFHAAVHGQPSPASVGTAAVDEFRCLSAIRDCAKDGRSRRIEVRS